MIDPNGPVAELNNAELGCWFGDSERKREDGVWTYTSRYLPTTALKQIAYLIEQGYGVKVDPRSKDFAMIKIWRNRH